MPEVNDHDLLIRLETKVDQFINTQLDHENRIRNLEDDGQKVKGSLKTIAGFVSFLGVFSAAAATIIAWLALGKG